MAEEQAVYLLQPGKMKYAAAWELQKRLFEKVRDKRDKHYLILTEHPPVITGGRNMKQKNLLVAPELLIRRGIEYFETDRGGDFTFHGPGQIVGYPILNLEKFRKDVHWYMRRLEEVIINVLADFNLKSGRIQGMTGVWVGNEKVCAMGVKITRWVTMHGFALNVTTDLRHFEYIIPCGITDKRVTSLQQLSGNITDRKTVIGSILKNFRKVFSVKLITAATADIPAADTATV